jgi:sugar lactone lactonase YvrE
MKLYTITLAASLFTTVAFGKTVPTGATANLVLGQSNFTTNTFPAAPSPVTLNRPRSIAVDPMTMKVFVADANDNRVLRYSSATALANGAPAEAVFGQPNLTSGGANNPTAERGMSLPGGIFYDRKGRLWVSQEVDDRVTMYENASFRLTGAFPNLVLGQPNFTTVTGGTTASTMNGPIGVCLDADDRLWVAEFSNNRILRFDNVSNKSTGDPADGVLGQPNFTINTSGATADKLDGPSGVSIGPNGSLYVSNQNTNRVFRYDNAANKPNGAPADVVLGQPNFASSIVVDPPTASSMRFPLGLFVTPDDVLWVSDTNNNRVLRFDQASAKTNGAAANGVVGQLDFVTQTPAVTDQKLNLPFLSPFVDGSGALWVPDRSNNRVLRFPADDTPPTLAVSTVIPKKTKKKKITISGTASDQFGISLVQFQAKGGPLLNATGTTAWQIKPALKKGKNKIVIRAIDSVGNVSKKTIKIERN